MIVSYTSRFDFWKYRAGFMATAANHDFICMHKIKKVLQKSI